MEKTAQNKRKVILIGLGVLGTGVAGFFGWHYWRNRKKANQEDDSTAITNSSNAMTTTTNTNTSSARNDEFPLKKGSKGNRVTQLQNAIVKKFGASALPKYGVDGMFGNEVAAALVRAKMPTTIDQATYTKLVGASGLSGIIKQGEEIVTTEDCEIFKEKSIASLKIPKHIVLGEKEFTHQGWIYFMPKNSTQLFRVKKENVKSLTEFKNDKS